MQSMAMQTRRNDEAVVMSMAAPSSYCRKPNWMLGGGAPPTALPEVQDRHDLVCGSQSTDLHPV